MRNRSKAVEYVVARGYSKEAAQKIVKELGIKLILESRGFIIEPGPGPRRLL